MGNQWKSWEGQRIRARKPRSFVPNVGRSRHRSGPGAWLTLPVFLAVVLIGVIAATYWPAAKEGDGGWSSAPIEWNAVQAVPRAAPDADDAAWMNRGDDEGADAAATPGGAVAQSAGPVRARFGLCHSGGGTNCVVDGDTLWIGGQNVRLADIDAPETHAPRCASEQALGDRATRRLHALVNSGAVTLSSIDRDQDRYGRKLRIVAVGGASVGDTLVGEGLARWYAGGRRSWCA
jgi:micrococcal nuclease